MPTQDSTRDGGKKKKELSRRHQKRKGPPLLGMDCNTKTQTRRGGLSVGIVLDSKRYFFLSLFLLPPRFLSFARLPTREREREKERERERPGREKMYCTFLRTRCIDCHTSVPEKRHCAIERCWALCFPLAPEAGGRGGRVGAPSVCDNRDCSLSPSPVRS